MTMHRRLPLLLAAALLGVVTSLYAQPSLPKFEPLAPTADQVPGRVVVRLERGISPTTLLEGEVARRYGIVAVSPWLRPELLTHGLPLQRTNARRESMRQGLARIVVVEYTAGDAPQRVAEAISPLAGVVYAEPALRRRLLRQPNDPRFSQQWYLQKINAPAAWDVTRGDSSIIIGIIDSGVEPNHPDVAGAIWHNDGERGNGREANGIDDDGNGFIDDTWGWDFGGSDGRTPDNDPTGNGERHGTFVAGIAAAQGENGVGIAGVAYGARIMAVKITDDLPFPFVGLYREAEGILYAAVMGAKVINASFGSASRSRAEEEVIRTVVEEMDVVLVGASGNDGKDVQFYPASYPGVISVAATDEIDNAASFTNYGYRVDLSAPGSQILSTGEGDYIYDSGTSFAAPIVSGSAALLRLRFPDYSAAQIAEILRATSLDLRDRLPAPYSSRMGAGRIDLGAAIAGGDGIAATRMISWRAVEETPDGIVMPGENIRIEASLANLLAPAASVHVALAAVGDPGLVIDAAAIDLGAMQSGERRLTDASAFNLTVPASTPAETTLWFRLTITTDGRTSDQYVGVPIAPSYRTTDLNDIAVTFNSVGNIGFNGINRSQGDGLVLHRPSGPTPNLLYHAGLMIGTSADDLADVVRIGTTSRGVNDGFRAKSLYRLMMRPDSSAQVGRAEFDDLHRPESSRIGLRVRLETYEYRGDDARNIVLAIYHLRNVGSRNLTDLKTGLYLDWDVSEDGLDDQAIYDPGRRLGTISDTRTPDGVHVGARLLTNQAPIFYAIDNDDEQAITDFTPERKWNTLASGVHESSTIDDMAMTIGGGNISLAPGEETMVAFALIAAPTPESFLAAADAAPALLGSSSAPRPAPLTEGRVEPLPAQERVTISFPLDRRAPIALTLRSVDGRRVAHVEVAEQGPGMVSLPLERGDLPAGIYLYTITAGEQIVVGRILFVP